MRSRLSTIILGFVLVHLSPVGAEPQPEKPESKSPVTSELNLQRLITQLGADEFAQREEALRKIHALGLEALPTLRKAINHPDIEVRRRVNTLIPKLETEFLMQPKRVTLKIENKPLNIIFEEITQQTGYKIQFWGGNAEQLYSVNLTNVPFWEALDRIGRDADLVVQQGYSDESVRLSNQNGYAPYVAYDGMFRFVAQSFQQVRNINFGLIQPEAPTSSSETLTLSFAMFVEPKSPFLGLGQANLRAAYDDERNSMLPNESVADGNNPWAVEMHSSMSRYSNKTFSTTASVQLRRPSEKAKKLKVIRGTIPVTLLSKSTPVVITDKLLEAKDLKKELKGDATIHIVSVKENPGGQYEVQMNIAMNDPQMDYSWTSSLYQRIKVFDKDDQPFSTYSSRWGGSGPNNVQLTFTYGRPGGQKASKPTKLVFESWETMHTLIPFEFHDLPLP